MMSVLRHCAQPHGHANQPIAHDTLHLNVVFPSSLNGICIPYYPNEKPTVGKRTVCPTLQVKGDNEVLRSSLRFAKRMSRGVFFR